MKYISSLIIAVSLLLLTAKTIHSQEVLETPPSAPEVTYLRQINQEDEKEILARLPADLKQDLLKVKEIDPERYRDFLMESSVGRYEVYFSRMEEFEKKRFETERLVQQLEVQTEALGIQYEHAKENQKSALVSRLKTKLGELFEMKEKARAFNVEMLERELAQLKESLSIRKQNKNEIINRRLNELIGKGDYLDW
jgi:hypothetical protein